MYGRSHGQPEVVSRGIKSALWPPCTAPSRGPGHSHWTLWLPPTWWYRPFQGNRRTQMIDSWNWTTECSPWSFTMFIPERLPSRLYLIIPPPGLAPALAARAAAAPPAWRRASAGSSGMSEGRESREGMASLLNSLSLAVDTSGGGSGDGRDRGGAKPGTPASFRCSPVEDGGDGGGAGAGGEAPRALTTADAEVAAPELAATATTAAPPPRVQVGSGSRHLKPPSTSPTHFPSPTRLQVGAWVRK